MTPYIPVSEPFEGDFYTIYEHLGTKYIHINGYTYKSSSNEFVTEDNLDGTYWANLEVCWFIFTLHDFIQNLRGNYNFVDDTYTELSQYQDDLTAEQMTETINHYFDGHGADGYLHFEELTEDTPCGNYINKLDLIIK